MATNFVITQLWFILYGSRFFFFTLEYLMSVTEVKNYGRKGKEENLISSSP